MLTTALRWCRRQWWKLLLGGAGLLLLLLGIAVYGLRYGFVPLPQAPDGFKLPYPPPGAVAYHDATNGWAVVRNAPKRTFVLGWADPLVALALGEPITVINHGQAPPELARDDWTERDIGETVLHGSRELANWIATSDAAPACFDRLSQLLRCPECFACKLVLSTNTDSADIPEFGDALDGSSDLALFLGACALEQGQPVAAMDYLTTVFSMEAASWLITGGTVFGSARALDLVNLACQSEGELGRAEGVHLLDALDQTARSLPSLEETFVAAAWFDLPRETARFGFIRDETFPTWGDWAEDVVGDLEHAWVRLPELGKAVWGRLMGVEREGSLFGILHLDMAQWAMSGWGTLAVQVACPADIRRVTTAAVSEGLARLRTVEDRTYRSLSVAERESRGAFRPPWWMCFSQPVAWRWHADAFSTAPFARAREQFLWRVGTARLMLALRLHRDATGDWPETLEALVPSYLDHLPGEPDLGRAFRYRRVGTQWVLWLRDLGRDPDDWLFSGTAFWSTRCLLGDWRSRLHEVGSAAFFDDTPNLDDLLALLPAGAGEVKPGAEPPFPPMDEAMMRRYGLLPP
ncbi:MAG: hypothetical protein KDM81_01805 [Verrucomicrobiae bacterium]|nr:hypothetical protein [Verrucomicrobiae bacterium]